MDNNKPNNIEAFREMIWRYLEGKASPEEIRFIETYYDQFEVNDNIIDRMDESEKLQLQKNMEAAIFERIKAKAPVRYIGYKKWIAAAAMIIMVMTAGIYLYLKSQPDQQRIASAPSPLPSLKNDIEPGGNKAILIFPDGKKIDLDAADVGEISNQAGAVVKKTTDGKVLIDASSFARSGQPDFNTIQTPAGGEYEIILPDGTKVWLNSSSKLEFPTAFTGPERVVKLNGEGYFEVAKNAAMPFRVKVNDMDVKVLGTHFNIMAYPDETSIKTTLLEGAVSISKGASSKLLKPGQQASTGSDENIRVTYTDVNAAVAWKNGYFQFERDNIQTVMRQLARWYDMEVVYEGAIPKDEFSGKIRRNVNVSKALEFLQKTGVHFKIEGKKVTVLSK